MINGIGWVFVYSENPKKLAEWYKEILKINFEMFEEGNTSYTMFWSQDENKKGRRLDTTFAIMKAKKTIAEKTDNDDKTDMYGDRSYMINLRLESMKNTLVHL